MDTISLIDLEKNQDAIITKIDESKILGHAKLNFGEIEARLLEMGFIEGANLCILHFGGWGKNPIAVRINNSSSIIALRRHEASAIIVKKM